jgi:hypothetical protein
MERVDVHKSKSGTAGGPLKPGFGFEWGSSTAVQSLPAGRPILSRILRKGGCGGHPPISQAVQHVFPLTR